MNATLSRIERQLERLNAGRPDGILVSPAADAAESGGGPAPWGWVLLGDGHSRLFARGIDVIQALEALDPDVLRRLESMDFGPSYDAVWRALPGVDTWEEMMGAFHAERR